MYKLLVFAGTTEGRQVLDYLAQLPVQVYASVATAYGKDLLPPYAHIEVMAGRLDQGAMAELMGRLAVDVVIDATHPYAVQATAAIQGACQQMGTPYLRLLRAESPLESCHYVADFAEAVAYLATTSGAILVTTGTKNLAYFTQLPDYSQRVYARVLPTVEALQQCQQLGIPAKHLICMQGPFSQDFNVALLRQIDAKFLVTKESGTAGGYGEKIQAAAEAEVQAIVVRRPVEVGYTLDEIKTILVKKIMAS